MDLIAIKQKHEARPTILLFPANVTSMLDKVKIPRQK